MGVYLLGFVGYQLWFTNLLTARDQNALASDLDERFESAQVEEVPVIVDPDDPGNPFKFIDPGSAVDSLDIKFLLQEPDPVEGEAFAQIRIPKVDVDVTVLAGVRRRDLKMGPGHMPGTPVPGQPGNAVISGHRTTYGAPFADLNDLVPGDRIEVDTAIGTHVYEVREAPERCRDQEGLCIVKPTELWVTDPLDGSWLTLTTCHPRFSARQRLIVFAQLVAGPNADVIVPTA
jgi:sortase A